MSHSLLNDQRKGRIINIGTRQAPKDLVQFLMTEADGFRENSILLKAEENGEPTLPEHYDRKILDSLKRSLGSTVYSLWYLNEPVDPKEIVFDITEEHFYDPRKINLDGLPHFTGVDLAISAQKRSNYTAIVTIAIDHDNRRYIRDIRRGRFQAHEIVDLLFAVQTLYRPRAMGIESTAYQAFLPRLMPYMMKERGQMLQIREVRRGSAASKEERIVSLQPWFENRPSGLPMLLIPIGSKDLLHELQDFRLDRSRRGTTDILDALADAVRLSEAGLLPATGRVRSEVILTDVQRARFYDVDWAIEQIHKKAGKPQLRFEGQLKNRRFAYLETRGN